jgi:hypothetical protein
MNIYFISGLGADERVFQKLTLPEKYQINHIKWPELSENETLKSYCHKISELIDTSQDFSLIGLSFGGIVATEITKFLKPKITIIISSISTRDELPFHYKICRLLKLNKIVPAFSMNKVYPFTYWYFGVKEQADKKLLKQVIKDTSPKFLKWAINEILNWQNEIRPNNLFHIHGTSDRLFPFSQTNADQSVKNGGHLMVYTNANKVSALIQDRLDCS